MKKLLLLPFILLTLSSCKKKSEDTSGIQQIRYGTSFKECKVYFGKYKEYCKNEMTLDSEKVIFKRSTWDETSEPATCELSQNRIVLDSIKQAKK